MAFLCVSIAMILLFYRQCLHVPLTIVQLSVNICTFPVLLSASLTGLARSHFVTVQLFNSQNGYMTFLTIQLLYNQNWHSHAIIQLLHGQY